MPLPEERRAQLDGIVQQMISAGESDDTINFVVNDFKSKYEGSIEKQPESASWDFSGPVKPAMIGMGKGLLRGAIGAGELVAPALRMIPGVRNLVATPEQFEQAKEMIAPRGTTEAIGAGLEQGLEMMIPANAGRALVAKIPQAAGFFGRMATRVLPNMASDAAVGASSAVVHGDDPEAAAAMSAVIPAGGAAVDAAAAGAKNTATRLVRAAIKPNVSEVKTWAGASREGLDKAANRVAQFIIENRLTTPEKAQAIIDEAEGAIQNLVGQQPTAAPQLAQSYLKILERSAARQGLPAEDVAAIRDAAAELVEGPMGEQIGTSLKLTNPGGQLTITPGAPIRALRRSVPADEALDSARRSSQWTTRKMWGEQKGATTEAAKGIEKAQRDAVKVAVPATRPHFAAESQGIKARTLLERSDFRQNNRDALGIGPQIMAAGEVASGKMPIMALAANLLRSGQLQGGMMADRLGNALRNNDVQLVTEILARLGVSLGADNGEQ